MMCGCFSFQNWTRRRNSGSGWGKWWKRCRGPSSSSCATYSHSSTSQLFFLFGWHLAGSEPSKSHGSGRSHGRITESRPRNRRMMRERQRKCGRNAESSRHDPASCLSGHWMRLDEPSRDDEWRWMAFGCHSSSCTLKSTPQVDGVDWRPLMYVISFSLIHWFIDSSNSLSEFSDENMMDPYNLAICFGPTLVPVPEDKDQVQFQNLVNELIKNIIINSEDIFPVDGGVVYERYISREPDEA